MITKAKFTGLLSNLFLISLILLFFLNFLSEDLFNNFFIEIVLLKKIVLIFCILFSSLFFYAKKNDIEKNEIIIEKKEELSKIKQDINYKK